jgi:cell wall-associated NlpC family hydrolase
VPRTQRIILLTLLLVMGASLLTACDEELLDAVTSSTPRWACPTPTPLPTIQVEDGTDTQIINGTPVARTRYRDTEPYEIEYGNNPLMTPTPYIKEGTNFYFGQIVNLGGGVDLTLDVGATSKRLGEERIYEVVGEITNPGGPFTLALERQVTLTAIRKTDGRMMGGTWAWSIEAARVAGRAAPETALETKIPTGRTQIIVPIAAPDGEVVQIDLRFDADDGGGALVSEDYRLQFSASREPRCTEPGTYNAVYEKPAGEAQPVGVPPGADSIVGTAMQQLGQQYCWGAKGFNKCSGCADGQCVTPACGSYPCFDCSGLTWYAYQQNGITIGHGTSNQKNYQAVNAADIQPGDLMLFTGGPVGSGDRFKGIRHVGLYVGDVDGDGTGDMVHSANYPDGVVLTRNVFSNRYYQQRLAVITRPPR